MWRRPGLSFAFASVNTIQGREAQGNYLDGVRLYTQSFLTLTQTHSAAPSNIVAVGDVVTHTVRVANEGESDASLAVLTLTLPVGAELVPGSVANAVLGSYTPGTRTDLIPEGMEIVPSSVSIIQGGAVVGGGAVSYPEQKVAWDLSALPAGQYVLKVDVIVKDSCASHGNDLYDNKATVHVFDADLDSNHTYHAFEGQLLRVRQIVLDRGPDDAQPVVGYLRAANNGSQTSLLCASGDWGIGTTLFTVYTLPETADAVYLLELIVPQGYALEGYLLGIDPAAHDSPPPHTAPPDTNRLTRTGSRSKL